MGDEARGIQAESREHSICLPSDMEDGKDERILKENARFSPSV